MKTKLCIFFFFVLGYKTINASSMPTTPPNCDNLMDLETLHRCLGSNLREIKKISLILQFKQQRIQSLISSHHQNKITLTDDELKRLSEQKACNEYQQLQFAMIMELHNFSHLNKEEKRDMQDFMQKYVSDYHWW